MALPTIDYTHVPRLLKPAAALSGAQATRYSVAFPATGGLQVVDATGAVLYLSTSPTPSDAALLSATQTFTGFNTFKPASATRVAGGASFDVDLSSVQTLSATLNAAQFGVKISAPVLNKVIGQPDIDDTATLFIDGAPSGTAVGLLTNKYGLLVFGGARLVGPVSTNAGLEIGSDLTFGGNYTITVPTGVDSPIVTASGTDYTIQVRNSGTTYLKTGAGGTVQIGDLTTSLIGEYGHVGTAQSAAIPDAAGGATQDTEARAAINSLLAYFRLRGTVAP